MSVLSVSAGLLLIFVFHIGFLPERLAKCHLRSVQFHFYFIFLSKGTDDHGQVLITHTIEQSLTVLCIVDCLDGQVFIHHLRQRLGNLVFIAFFLCLICHISIRPGDLGLAKHHRYCLRRQGIAGLAAGFSDGSDISCMKLVHFNGLIASHDIKLVQLLFCFCRRVEQYIVRFNHTGANLDQRIFSNERVRNGLEHIGRFCFGEIVICLEDLVGLGVDAGTLLLVRRRQKLHDVIQHIMDVPKLDAGAHGYRNDTSVIHIHLHGSTDLTHRELFACKITLHEFLAGLCHRIHHGFPVDVKVRLTVIRNLTVLSGADAGETASCHLHDIYVTYKLLILTDRLIERRNLLAVQIRQRLHYFTERSIVHIHIRYKEHARQLVFLTELPCLLRPDFHACLTGYDDDRRIRRCHCLFHLAYEIKKSGRI